MSGVRFSTNAQPGSEEERALQKIQYELADGVTNLPSPTTLPHLNLYSAAATDGPTNTYISLWVPNAQQAQAAELLQSAGYAVA